MNNVTVLVIAFGVAILLLLYALYETMHSAKLLECVSADWKIELSEEDMEVTEQDIKDSGLSRETILRVRSLYKRQKEEKLKEGSGWDFWDERVHVENLLCKRINYLILCYSLFVAAFAAVGDRISKTVVLSVGFVVMYMMSLFLARAWRKLDMSLKFIFVLYPRRYNGLLLIDELVKNAPQKPFFSLGIFNLSKLGIPYNKLVGLFLPVFLCISFAIGIILIIAGVWDVGK